jgi:hypothetical protein
MNAPFEHIPSVLPTEAVVRRVFVEGGVPCAELLAEGHALTARVARGVQLEPGVEALVLHAASGQAYVVASLGAPPAPRVQLEDGVAATMERDAAGVQVLRVTSASGETLFEYESGARLSTVRLGDHDVRVEVGGTLTLHGREGLRLSSCAEVAVASPTLNVQASTAQVAVDSVDLRAKRVLNRIDHLKTITDLLETTAGRIVERARDTLREAEGVSQTRAGRLRFIAQSSLHTLAESTVLVSRGDTKLKGNRIHLG